jgi:hypothetical protein
MFGRLDVLHLINLREILFIKRMLSNDNMTVHSIMNHYVHYHEFYALQSVYNINVCCTVGKINALMHASFKSLFAS